MNLRPAPELRTRPPAPVTIDRPEPPRCVHCHAVLRTGNQPRGTCDPCDDAGKPPADLPFDPERPTCACGCGTPMRRPMNGGVNNYERTTGPFNKWAPGHHHRKGVTNGETT